MSLEISVKMTMTANFHINIDDIERATDESPVLYHELYESVAGSNEFYDNCVLPAMVDIFCRKPNEIEFETIGDGCGQHDIYLNQFEWRKFVDQKFLVELQADELRERIKDAIDSGEYETAMELTKQLAEMEA